jgi:hypothetical protein
MSDENPTFAGRRHGPGTAATILGVFAFGSLLSLFTPLRAHIGFYLFCASPLVATVSISLGSWELIGLKRGRATAKSGAWAWFGIVTSSITIICFTILITEAYVFVRGMQNHPH